MAWPPKFIRMVGPDAIHGQLLGLEIVPRVGDHIEYHSVQYRVAKVVLREAYEALVSVEAV